MEAEPTIDAATELFARARLICGPEHVVTDPVVLSTYRSDGVKRDGPLPLAVVLPGSASEVAGVVAACADAEISWTVRGAGTSQSGVALASAGQVLIVLARMRRILRGRDADDELTLEPGVPLAALSRLSSAVAGAGGYRRNDRRPCRADPRTRGSDGTRVGRSRRPSGAVRLPPARL
jgi:hypothetical protein